jgi:hypothetical protein
MRPQPAYALERLVGELLAARQSQVLYLRCMAYNALNCGICNTINEGKVQYPQIIRCMAENQWR